MTFRKDINGLRAWAVTLVVLFHFDFPIFSGGFIGVDIFFVISGFLMAGILTKKLESSSARLLPKEIVDFYLARARRILPALLALCATTIIAGWFYLSPAQYNELADQVVAALGFYSNNFFLGQSGYFETSSNQKLLLHTWSLSVEWQFYIMLPLFMSTVWLFRKNRKWQFLAACAAGITSLTYCIYLANSKPDAAFYSTFSRAWEMLAGSLVYFLTSQNKKEHKGLETAGFLIIIFSATLLNASSAWPDIITIFPVLAAAMIIYSNSNSYWTSGKLIQYIGERSYSIYLWHWPLAVSIRFIDPQNPILATTIGIFLTLILAEVSYRLIEKKAKITFLPSKRNLAFLASLTPIIFVVSLGFIINKADGYPNRFPAKASDLARYKFSLNEYRDGKCFMRPEQTHEAFNNCNDSRVHPAQTILLWGDSHAAHLYPGILKNLPKNKSITQFTASGCPPFIGVDINDRKNCRDINDFVADWIINNQPGEVILSARWSKYNWKSLRHTLEFLQAKGVNNITVFGPAPIWNRTLTDILLKNSLLNNASLPEREKNHLISDDGTDEGIRKISREYGVNFVSVRKIFCTEQGCMTYLNTKNGPVPTAWDTAHLSSEASDHLIFHSKIFNSFF
ncbi:acyltransferase family protein [Pseudomonas ogarae]|uniref:Glucans biosynthesis protein MdoC n=1 Tax=Pseudomonas ogarae (strain DSM 112162 / CECT 30235 / F113) TaxID=1114970 RepID=A0ABM6QXA1_PSEO1|nr:acyltransferase family protein [Pseudomonas ogarae]AEV61682.1 O-antigen acetylase [Pseudomonas ogarae]AUO45552.1 glucans biosynthesis protein MdoC [Pseudomonas ogarae]